MPSEARRIRGREAPEKKKGGPGVLPRKIYINGMQMVQIYAYLANLIPYSTL